MHRATLAALALLPGMVLLAPALSLALAIRGFVAIGRWIGRRLEPAFMTWTELIEFDPRLGWKPRARLSGSYFALNDDVYRIVTDEEGWPGLRTIDESDLIAVGDSFAFGYGAHFARTFAALSRGVRVKGIGAPGYSMVHGLLVVEALGRRLAGKLVVWLVCLDNDLQDNLAPEMRGYRAPFVRRRGEEGEWEIVTRHLSPDRWRASDMDSRRLLPSFCVPGALADRAFSACDYLIGRARLACSAADATLVIVTVPRPEQLGAHRAACATAAGSLEEPDLPDRRFAESCRRHGVPLVVGREFLTPDDYKRREGVHWSARGHRRMAALCEGLYAAFREGTLSARIPPAGTEFGRGARRPAGPELTAAVPARVARKTS